MFPPPPGSRLVVDVMNRIKHDYPFVDLLKPETTAAIPLLLALEPSIVRSALDLYRLRREANRYAPDKHGKIPDLTHISDPGREPEPIVGVIDRELPPDVARAYADAVDRDLGGLAAVDAFLRAEQTHTPRPPARESDLAPMSDGAVSSALGLLSMLGKPTLAARMPALRRALQVLRDDRSFVLDSDDDNSPYVLAARRLASARPRHVLFGHTHLAKHIELGDGRTYTNTGTWADLAQIPFDDVIRMTDVELMAAIAEFLAALRGPRGTHSWIRWLPYCAVFHVTEDGHTPTAPELVPATELVPGL